MSNISFFSMHETVGTDETVKSYWTAFPTGDWFTDCATGRARADELLAHMAATDSPIILQRVVDDFKRMGGIEVGFLTRIAQVAIC